MSSLDVQRYLQDSASGRLQYPRAGSDLPWNAVWDHDKNQWYVMDDVYGPDGAKGQYQSRRYIDGFPPPIMAPHRNLQSGAQAATPGAASPAAAAAVPATAAAATATPSATPVAVGAPGEGMFPQGLLAGRNYIGDIPSGWGVGAETNRGTGFSPYKSRSLTNTSW